MSKKKTPTFLGSITSIFKNIENIFLFYAYFPRDVTVFAYSNRSKGIFRDETRINIYIRRRFSSQLVFPFFQTGKSLRYPFCVPSWWTDVLCLRNETKKIMGPFCTIFSVSEYWLNICSRSRLYRFALVWTWKWKISANNASDENFVTLIKTGTFSYERASKTLSRIFTLYTKLSPKLTESFPTLLFVIISFSYSEYHELFELFTDQTNFISVNYFLFNLISFLKEDFITFISRK